MLCDIINYTWTLTVCVTLASFSLLSSRIISQLPWEACIDNLNKIGTQFLLLFWSHACYGLPVFRSVECHRSLLYKITIQLHVQTELHPTPPNSLPPFSLSLVAWLVLSSAVFDASAEKTQRHEFVLFFPPSVLGKVDVLFLSQYSFLIFCSDLPYMSSKWQCVGTVVWASSLVEFACFSDIFIFVFM